MAGRRPSLRRQDSSDSEQSNLFADSNALNIADIDQSPLFEDSTVSRRNSVASQISHHTISIAVHHATDTSNAPAMARRELRNSIRKSRSYFENPFNSHDDADAGQYAGGPSMSTMAHRRVASNELYADSDVDDGEFADTQMTFPPGPSHDYSAFSQNTTSSPLLRSSTINNSLVARVTSRSSLHGPAHPYTMYPQNVDEDIDDNATEADGDHPNQHIPIGFPRNAPRFRNDLDNMSEQLPPYSEYPEDGAPKHIAVPPRIAAVAPSTSASSLHTVIHRARQPQSMADDPDDNSLLESATSTDAEVGLLSGHQKTWKQKSWREKRETKFCGIPFGWILLVSGTFLFITVVLSAVIGGFYTWHAKHAGNNNSSTLWDAERIYNASAPALTTGSFQLQLGTSQETQNQCITNSSQSDSWSCGVASPTALALNIAASGSMSGTQLGFIYEPEYAVPKFIGYGTLPPSTWSSVLRLVTDMDLPQYGPAWQFQAVYTKTVVAHPDAFYPTYVGANGLPAAPPSQQTRFKTIEQGQWLPYTEAGDQPWICYWNNTLLEAFVYVNETSTAWYSNSTLKELDEQHNVNKRQDATQASGPAASPTTAAAAAAAAATTGGLPYLNRVIKIEERRVPGYATTPMCQKMQILDNGDVSPLLNPDGEPYQVTITEDIPDSAAYTSAYGSGSKQKRTTVSGSCHCQWMSGQTQAS